jgi:hypothetical protein
MVVSLDLQMVKKATKYIRSKIKSLKLFDWILILFGLMALIIFTVILFRKSTYITATVSVGDDSVVYGSWVNTGPKTWFANLFYKGEAEKDGLGRIEAEVLNVYSYDTGPNNKKVYIEVKLNSVYNSASRTYTYKGVPVLVGSTIKLNLDNVYAEGLITEVQGFPNDTQKQYIKISARVGDEETTFLGTSATKTYIADAINIGDVVKDNYGQVLIRVLNKQETLAKVSVTTSNGRIVESIDPTKKDVILTLQILAENVNGKYYFLNDIPILVDQMIPLNLPTISVFPTVTNFLPN